MKIDKKDRQIMNVIMDCGAPVLTYKDFNRYVTHQILSDSALRTRVIKLREEGFIRPSGNGGYELDINAPRYAEQNERREAMKKEKAVKGTKKTGEKKAPRKSAAAMFKSLIMEGKLKDAAIFEKCQKEFDLSDDKKHYVKWYRNWLRKNGDNPPALIGEEKKAAPKKEKKVAPKKAAPKKVKAKKKASKK